MRARVAGLINLIGVVVQLGKEKMEHLCRGADVVREHNAAPVKGAGSIRLVGTSDRSRENTQRFEQVNKHPRTRDERDTEELR